MIQQTSKNYPMSSQRCILKENTWKDYKLLYFQKMHLSLLTDMKLFLRFWRNYYTVIRQKMFWAKNCTGTVIFPSSILNNFFKKNRINPFVSNTPFLYPLKALENRKVFWCFQGVEKGCIGNKWVKVCDIGPWIYTLDKGVYV